jgi:hypothetical protein
VPDVIMYQYLISLKSQELMDLYPDGENDSRFSEELHEYAEEII